MTLPLILSIKPQSTIKDIVNDSALSWQAMKVRYAWFNTEGFIEVTVTRRNGHTRYLVKLKCEHGQIHARLIDKTGADAQDQTLIHNPEIAIAVAAVAKTRNLPINVLSADGYEITSFSSSVSIDGLVSM